MAPKTSLTQTLTQRLHQRLSPLQMKFVHLLEMSQPEVEEEVRHELEENPALSTVDNEPDLLTADDYGETPEQLQLADYSDDDEIPHSRPGATGHHAAFDYAEATTQSAMTLMEYLTGQINELHLKPEVAAAAEYIIGNLDNNGYLSRPLRNIADDVAFSTGIEIPFETWQAALTAVKSLDPAGVGASDLRDCLLIQLRRLPDDTPSVDTAREIIAHYFDLFSLRHFHRLESALGVSSEALSQAVELIKSLNPKPGGDIGEDPATDRSAHIIPDFMVEPADDDDPGRFTITLPNTLPELTIENSFRIDPADKSAGTFVARRRESASDFIDMLRLRNETLMRVMTAIVNLQPTFFITGDESDLKPMVLKDIAAATGYDISVISRATAGKYVATPSGVFPLKSLFNEGIQNGDAAGEGHSTPAVLAAMKEIIEDEDSSAPLSDDAIKARLSERGIDIARRTVAKYRERLGFPPARLRKGIR